jgi:hypothetical protein
MADKKWTVKELTVKDSAAPCATLIGTLCLVRHWSILLPANLSIGSKILSTIHP